MRSAPALLAIVSLLACGSDDTGSGEPGGSSHVGGTGASSTTGAGGAGAHAGGSGGELPSGFRYGINLGHRNADWGDAETATLAAQAGARSMRVKLPAMHLATWGYDIEVGDLEAYASLGMRDHIGFLIGSESVELTVAPEGSEDWQNEYYLPRNLYEPVTLGDGSINPDNYWASYVFRTVDTYQSWIQLWHVWNEPDWVADWSVTESWTTSPPSAADLPRFNGSIFDYIRMLRVTREAARAADPNALIATGGIGYPSFLSAILRYTDNPVDGSVTADYPQTGGAYVDVVDFHYYPIFSPKSSDGSVDGLVAAKAELAQVLTDADGSVAGWNVSETGAPLAPTSQYPQVGGAEYARNYLLKAFVVAQAEEIGGVDWFILSNGAAASDDVFDHMGLYEDIAFLASPDEATKTDLGRAYTTLGTELAGARYDATASAALGLAAAVRGACFTREGARVIVLWARTPETGEAATASVSLATETGFDVVAWDGTTTAADATGGAVTLELTGSPVVLRER